MSRINWRISDGIISHSKPQQCLKLFMSPCKGFLALRVRLSVIHRKRLTVLFTKSPSKVFNGELFVNVLFCALHKTNRTMINKVTTNQLKYTQTAVSIWHENRGYYKCVWRVNVFEICSWTLTAQRALKNLSFPTTVWSQNFKF